MNHIQRSSQFMATISKHLGGCHRISSKLPDASTVSGAQIVFVQFLFQKPKPQSKPSLDLVQERYMSIPFIITQLANVEKNVIVTICCTEIKEVRFF